MTPSEQVARKLLLLAEALVEDSPHVVEAAKRESQPHDPFITELSEIMGRKVFDLLSGSLATNFPGDDLAKMRENIRKDTLLAFHKSTIRNFNAKLEQIKAPGTKVIEKAKSKKVNDKKSKPDEFKDKPAKDSSEKEE